MARKTAGPAGDGRTAAQRLKAAERKISLYEAILNRLDVGLHVIGTNEETIVYNAMMGKLESELPANVLGKKLLEAMPHLDAASSTLITALRTGRPLADRRQTYTNTRGKQVVTVNSTSPLYVGDELVGALEIAKDVTFIQALAEKIADLHQNLSARKAGAAAPQPFKARYTFADIAGDCDAIQAAVAYAARAARSTSTILIFGETGTGKELFAQSIHNASPRKDQPFIAVNCAALPEQLLEGLLFGTARGGFTGAIDRPGFFEQAGGGTLLLDEINSMNPNLQAKLLRALQEQSVRRVGGTAEIAVKARVVATINVDPYQAIAQKQLREDLYYRLGVVTLRIPPLREHPADIPLYVRRFIAAYNRSLGLAVRDAAPGVLDAFGRYPWPGNIRELQHAVEGAMNLIGGEETLQLGHFPALFRAALAGGARRPEGEDAAAGSGLIEKRDAVELSMIKAALAGANGNITRAAAALGLTRQLLQYKLKKYRLR